MLSIFRDADQLENVEQQLLEMLASCEDTFDLATGAIFGELDVTEAGDKLDLLDKGLNKSERSIRRELLVHGTVRGAEVDQGLMLTYMSISKDIERIGDYCKNIWNLAELGVNLSGEADSDELKAHRDRVATLIDHARETFSDQDDEKVHELIPSIKEDTARYDEHVIEWVKSEEPGRIAAPRALFYRYLKRISSHLANVLTSVVMPVDRLDFYKKSKALETESE